MVLISIVLTITVSLSLEVDIIVMKYAVPLSVFGFVGFVSEVVLLYQSDV